MLYLLDDGFALRGWLFNLFTLLDLRSGQITILSSEEFDVLLRCDGTADIPADDTGRDLLAGFLDRGVIRPCREGEHLQREQKYRFYGNWLFEEVFWAITSRCNFNCLHCFAAKDAAPMVTEPSFEQCLRIIDQLEEAGVQRVFITGGEPLTRPDFLQITGELSRRGIWVEGIGTNASLFTDELLDALIAQGHYPRFQVSFDGVGHHDWMRGARGAEQMALDGIRRIKGHGLWVMAQYCLSRANLDTMQETTRLLESLGVNDLRVIRVAESLRWLEKAPELSLSLEENAEIALEYADWFLGENITMNLDYWEIFKHSYGDGTCRLVPARECSPESDRTQCFCGDARRHPFISSTGELAPCNQISGYASAVGMSWGNVFETPLTDLMRESPFTRQLLSTRETIRNHNPECQTCEWKHRCACGCRVLALESTRDFLGRDYATCTFFKGGFYDRFLALADKHGLRVTY